MVDISNILDNFNNNKEKIIDEFALYYGDKYKNKITNNINKTHFLFESLPTDNYTYIKQYRNIINQIDFFNIENEYLNYQNVLKQIKKIADKIYFYEISIYFKDKRIKDINGFGKLVKDYMMQNSNETFEKYKEEFIKYGFNIDDLDDNFSKYYNKIDNKVKLGIQKYLLKKTLYGKRLSKIYDTDDIAILNHAAFELTPSNMKMTTDNYYVNYIKIPIVKFLNQKNVSIDEILIHEIIHSIESSIIGVGLTKSDDDKNNVANEVRTQLLAKKITKNLHDKNVYIYDERKKYKPYCNYENLFMFAKIFDFHEEIFKYCSINNKSEYLNILYGDDWDIYSNELKKLYFKLNKVINNSEFSKEMLQKINNLQINMIRYFNLKGKDELISILENANNKLTKKKNYV